MFTSVSDIFQLNFKFTMTFYWDSWYETDYYISSHSLLERLWIIYISIELCFGLDCNIKNLRCMFLLLLISIPYMIYNNWIKKSRYVCTILILPPYRMSLLIWSDALNEEQYIYFMHPNLWFISCVYTNTCLGIFIYTCRAYVLGPTYIFSVTLW